MTARAGTAPASLWLTDGHAEGTSFLASNVAAYTEFSPLGEERAVFFAGELKGLDFEPWVTDGTPEGARELAPADATNTSQTTLSSLPFVFNDMLLLGARFHGEPALDRYRP